MKVLKIGFLIAGSMAGAGFASGKEIMTFFTKYENMGLWALTLCAVLLIIFGYIGIKLAYDIKAKTLREFLDYYFGSLSFWFQCIITIFMFVVFSVMLCGAGEIIFIYTGLDYFFGSIIFLFCVMWSTSKGQEFIQKISVVLMGILFFSIIVFSIFINIKNSGNAYIDVFAKVDDNYRVFFPLWSAFIYCGYNALLAISSLLGISMGLKNKKFIFLGSIAGAIIFILPAFLMNSAMLPFITILDIKTFPFISLLQIISNNLGLLYAFIVFLAMALSAMINGYFLRKINKFLPICGYLFVFTGFSEIIRRIYPVFGIGGIIFLSILIIRYFMIYFESESISYDKKARGG